MHWKLIGLSVLLVVTLWFWIGIPIGEILTKSAIEISTNSPTPSATSTNPSNSSQGVQSTDNSNSTIIAAIISGSLTGVIGTLITAFIGFLAIRYQTKHNNQKEIDNLKTGHQEEIKNLKQQHLIELQQKTDQITQLQQEHINRIANIDQYVLEYLDNMKTYASNLTRTYINAKIHEEIRLSFGYQMVQNENNLREPERLLRLEQRKLNHLISNAQDLAKFIQDISQANSDSKHYVLEGDPFVGKTLLLRYLVRETANSPKLPIYIDLHRFAKAGKEDLLEYISTQNGWKDLPHIKSLDYIKDHLRDGAVLLLLDALDGAATGDSIDQKNSNYNRVASAIVDVGKRYIKSPIIVTTRKARYQTQTRLENFTTMDILSFGLEQMEHFIAERAKQAQPMMGIDLITQIKLNFHIQALAANPRFLDLIITYQENQNLPERYVDFYKKFIVEESMKDLGDHRFNSNFRIRFLEKVAWQLHKDVNYYFKKDDLRKKVPNISLPDEFLEKNFDAIFDEIVLEDGLLKKQALDEVYSFSCLTLQEYFASQYAVNEHQVDELLKHLDEPWWEEVILLYASSIIITDLNFLLQKLIEDNRFQDNIFQSNLILAGHCLAVRTDSTSQIVLYNTILSSLLRELMETPFALAQEQIAYTLSEFSNSKEKMSQLQYSTSNGLADHQLQSDMQDPLVDALMIKPKCLIALLLLPLVLNKHIDLGSRRHIADALAGRNRGEVITKLIDLLSTDFDQKASRRIADILGILRDSSVIPRLLPLLLNPAINPDVRWSIANAIATIGDCSDSLIEALMNLLFDKNTNLHVRWGIASAMAMLGEHSDKVVTELQQKLPDVHDLDIHWIIITTLRTLGDDESPLNCLVPDPLSDEHIHKHIGSKLIDLFGPLGQNRMSMIGKLCDLVIDSNSQITSFARKRILDVLRRQADDQETVNKLTTLLQDPKIQVSDIGDSIYLTAWEVKRRMKR